MGVHKNICFVHVEKAGGTTFHDLLMHTLDGYRILPPLVRTRGWRYTATDIRKLRRFLKINHVGGHQVGAFLDLDQVFDDPLYVTFVRDPEPRFLSHVNWLAKHRDEATVRRYFDEGSNGQCFRICGSKSFDDARRVIESKNIYVGLTERYLESVFVFQKWLGWPLKPFQPSNVTRQKDKVLKAEALGEELRAQVRQANREDQQLYDWVVTEWYPRLKARIDWNDAEFQSFEAAQTQYRRSRWFELRKALRNRVTRWTCALAGV